MAVLETILQDFTLAILYFSDTKVRKRFGICKGINIFNIRKFTHHFGL
jgi:hypothetical protein